MDGPERSDNLITEDHCHVGRSRERNATNQRCSYMKTCLAWKLLKFLFALSEAKLRFACGDHLKFGGGDSVEFTLT